MADRPTELLDIIRLRRTARVHGSDPVAPEAIQAILESARWAPSAANRQPWEFILVTSGEQKTALRSAFLAEAEDRDPKYRSVTEKQADLLQSPGLILVCGDPETKTRYVNAAEIGDTVQEELFLLSMGAAIQNMLLMATAWGLTSTWIARPARIRAIHALLGLPERLRGVAFVALGAGAKATSWDEHMRHAASGKTHIDRYQDKRR